MKASLLASTLIVVSGCGLTRGSESSPQGRIGFEHGAALLGSGFDTRASDFLSQCVTSGAAESPVKVEYVGAPTSQFDLKRVDSFSSLKALLDVQVSGKLRYPSFSVSGAARFISDAQGTESSQSLVFTSFVRGKNALISDPVLSKDGVKAKALEDKDDTAKLCGDTFVSQVELGAQLFIMARFDFGNAAAKSEFDAKIGFDYLNIFEVEGAAKVLSENAKRNAIITVSAFQMGGNVERIFEILAAREGSNYAVMQCSIEKADACLATLNKFIDYASNPTTGFASQLKSLTYDTSTPGGAAALGYVTKRYDQGSADTRTLYEAPPAVLGAAVKDAREWLERRYAALSIDAKKVEKLQRLYLSEEQKTQFQELQDRIARSSKRLLEVATICYTDFDKCAPAKAELETLLASEEYFYEPAKIFKKYNFMDYCMLPGQPETTVRTVVALKKAAGFDEGTECERVYEDLEATSILDLKKLGINDVRPLRGLTRVRSIDLSENEIRNPSALFELNGVRNLNLRNNKISVIDGIESMASLESLDIVDNDVEEITPVFALSKLKTLKAHGNRIAPQLAADPMWQQLPSLTMRSLSDREACANAADVLVERDEVAESEAKLYLSRGMGPTFKRDGALDSPFEQWVRCSAAARFL